MTTPLVDVVILSWNDGELLRKAVASALRAADHAGLDVAVLVVDNASAEPPLLVDDPRVRLRRNATNRGVAGGRNDGLRITSAPYVCLLDSDAELAPESLQVLLDVVVQDERIAVAVPVFRGQPPEASAGAAPTLALKLQRMRNRRDDYRPVPRPEGAETWDVDFGIGACQLLRRSAFDAVGGLDERLWWAEDADFCLRLKQAGWRVVQTDRTTVLHPPRRRFKSPLTRRGLRHGVAVLRLLWRHRHFAPLQVDHVR